MSDSIGTIYPVKDAFYRYLLRFTDEIIGVTPALSEYAARPLLERIKVCSDRLGDTQQVLGMLQQYTRAANGDTSGLNAPVPVILLAFGKDLNPIQPEAGQSIPNEKWVRLRDDPTSPLYKARFDHVEKRAQIVIVSYEDETANAIGSQLRLFMQRFENHRWPIDWEFGGQQFTTTCTLESQEPMDEPQDIPDRTNITVVLVNVNLRFQIPYMRAPANATNDSHGIRSGFPAVQHVDITDDGRLLPDFALPVWVPKTPV